MAAGRRNATVVIALVVSMTIGVALLLWLEPGEHRFRGDTLLTAQRGTVPVSAIEVTCASSVEAYYLAEEGGADSLCVVYPDGSLKWWRAGSRWWVVAAVPEGAELTAPQMQKLLGVLGRLDQLGGRETVPVRFVPVPGGATVAEQAEALRALLVRKQLIQ